MKNHDVPRKIEGKIKLPKQKKYLLLHDFLHSKEFLSVQYVIKHTYMYGTPSFQFCESYAYLNINHYIQSYTAWCLIVNPEYKEIPDLWNHIDYWHWILVTKYTALTNIRKEI